MPISAERLCKFLRAKIGGVGVARLSHLNRRPIFKKTLDKVDQSKRMGKPVRLRNELCRFRYCI